MNYKVCVRCFTYNQSQYITEAMDGFVMQQTDFPFVCCIVDDASTDGEQEVIKEYLSANFEMDDQISYEKETDDAFVIYARHKVNHNCFFAVLMLKYNHRSIRKAKIFYLSEWQEMTDYEAICEGDDYWTHPQKLQMQVDFMDAHPDYSMCHTNFTTTVGKRWNDKVPQKEDDDYLKELINGEYQVGTATTMSRLSIKKKLANLKKWIDVAMWIELAAKGKIKYLDICTAAYRVLSNSMSHNDDINKELSFFATIFDIRAYYGDLFKIDYGRAKQTYLASSMKCAYKHKDGAVARKLYKEMIQMNCFGLKTYLLYLGTVSSSIRWLMLKVYKLN